MRIAIAFCILGMSIVEPPDLDPLDLDPPATVDILQRVKSGQETAFEGVLAELIEAARTFEGHLGARVFRPRDRDCPEYRIVFKFARMSDLKQWEISPIRQRLLDRAQRLTVGSGKVSILTGLETWFTLPHQPGRQPPARYKMVAISSFAIYVLINSINVLAGPLLRSLPALLRTFVVTFLTVVIMTYIVMPRLTKVFASWLDPGSEP